MKNKAAFISIVLILLCSGLCGQFAVQESSLSGVTQTADMPTFHFPNIWNGTWQETYEDYLSDNLKLRNLLIPMKNQIVYSVLRSSPNENIVIGKNNSLFEEEYIDFETQIYSPMSQDDIEQLVQKLVLLNDSFHEMGKHFFIFVTPSKAEIYKEEIPDRFLKIAPTEQKTSTYELFMDALEHTGIAYYDSIPDVRVLKETSEFRVFPLTGTHWSSVTAAICAEKLADSMETQLGINLPETNVSYEKCDEPISPDSDLYDALNLIRKSRESFYRPISEITDYEKNDYTIFARGGSFMGSSLGKLISSGYFEDSYYLENTIIRCSDRETDPVFSNYDQLPVKELINNSDIIFLEVNEEAIPRMSFGFIEYLLDNNVFEK